MNFRLNKKSRQLIKFMKKKKIKITNNINYICLKTNNYN